MRLDNRIVAKMQEQHTHDNAAKYSRRLTDQMAAHKRDSVSAQTNPPDEFSPGATESTVTFQS